MNSFKNKPLTYFKGLIPLFVQWTDCEQQLKVYYKYINNKTITNKRPFNAYIVDDIFRPLLKLLRKDVIYITVSQANVGLQFLTNHHPNVIVLNAGGDGNIAIPLIKSELSYSTTIYKDYRYYMGFYGNLNHGPRSEIFNELIPWLKKFKYIKYNNKHNNNNNNDIGFDRFTTNTTSNNNTNNTTNINNSPSLASKYYKFGQSSNWITDTTLTLFNLDPIGMGRQSFRTSVCIYLSI
jgi:hypothetical protein